MALVRLLESRRRSSPRSGSSPARGSSRRCSATRAFRSLRLSYAEDGGELGHVGRALAAAAPLSARRRTRRRLDDAAADRAAPAGTHEGPLVLDRPQQLVGEDGAVVRGGIVIRADDVTVRNVTVVGGENGIDVDVADDVVLDDVRVLGSPIDGIHVRRSSVTIRDCDVALPSDYGQGIDISFSFDHEPSLVEDCAIDGAWEGIVSHSSRLRLEDNTVRATTSRGITVTEMSMGSVESNMVESARGSASSAATTRCATSTERRHRHEARHADGRRDARGYAIQSHFCAHAESTTTA